MLADRHKALLSAKRYKSEGSEVTGRSLDEEAISDRGRVVYSSAFRRLQQKTQVFTIAKDAAVRSRLTHSLEVANVGRWIAQRVASGLFDDADRKYAAAFVYLVETGCLAHDIGNPPFGHFGETAIQRWFKSNWPVVAGHRVDKKLEQLMEDFLQFDGNPQGTRILTRLQGRTKDERQRYGMDLTFSQVLTALKYPRGPKADAARWKKAGFFESERPRIQAAWKELGFSEGRRFPLAYMVEAADDISYCISDMEDGIDQGILTPKQVFEGIREWTERDATHPIRSVAKRYGDEVAKPETNSADAKDLFIKFKTAFTKEMIEEAARQYEAKMPEVLDGTLGDLLEGTDAHNLLEQLKGVARRYLYPADKVQRPFLAGLRVVQGILDEYSQLLQLTQEQFELLRQAWQSADRKRVREAELETLLPILDTLPSHYLDVYDFEKMDVDSRKKWGNEAWEWFCRAHLIVDYLSGMTDDFACRTYRVISGVSLE